MKRFRIGIAAAAAGTLLGLAVVAGFAAHGAFAHAAGSAGGAARAVYCPDKQRRHEALKAFERSEQAQKQAFFATHPSPAARKAFLEQQQARRKALVAAYAHCT